MKYETKKIVASVISIISVIVLVCCFYVYRIHILVRNNVFAKEIITFSNENKSPVFKVNKILLYSSANAIDNNEQGLLKDLDISQYTDISIYVDNTISSKELTNKNTIKEMYIDNIRIESTSDIGEKALSYKNPLDFAKFKDLSNFNDRIDFNIIRTNNENAEADYNNPVFYTDCSNPIPLGYVNKNIVRSFNDPELNKFISFDGSILQKANVNLNELKNNISFDIHIKNNLDEEYLCSLTINNLLGNDNIYKGYSARMSSTEEISYHFLNLCK